MDREVPPIINPYWERAEFPHELVPKLADLGIAGFQIEGYGCPGMSNVTAGLVIMELPSVCSRSPMAWCRPRGGIVRLPERIPRNICPGTSAYR
jgi:alkylation response protein AidB-like acyl-CoA dehydrogenase